MSGWGSKACRSPANRSPASVGGSSLGTAVHARALEGGALSQMSMRETGPMETGRFTRWPRRTSVRCLKREGKWVGGSHWKQLVGHQMVCGEQKMQPMKTGT
eukprot:11251221-Heterocapsa_arctica.AAC.1